MKSPISITLGVALPEKCSNAFWGTVVKKYFSRKGAKAQRKPFKNAVALCAFAPLRERSSGIGTFRAKLLGVLIVLIFACLHGDAGRPESAQILRMLQLEKGAMNLGGPPWKEADRYRAHSAIHQAHKVETPVLLIHGELDFIPIQQSEEFFTALFRQDKRVRLLRYAGEGHTISDRANVLDLWQRIESWLKETMAPRKPS